ncbi:MAG TPA: multiheme c-type cytochrome [Polyangiaceae bacterium]|nr:multiheme c-type cytochrome [Polyangiaceae bacterium]
MKRCFLVALLTLLGCGNTAPDPKPGPTPSLTRAELLDPETCKKCHEKHYREWSGSMHAYAADDPVFVAMNRRGQAEGKVGKFCVKCHAPMAVAEGATDDGLNLDTLPKHLKGVTCFFCHSVDSVDDVHDNPLHLASDLSMRGALRDAVPNEAHASTYSPHLDGDRLESAVMCGSCHDIQNAHGVAIERTLVEWKQSVFAQAGTRGRTCGHCHMDPSVAPDTIADAPGVFLRTRHSHMFPGVDLALTPWPEKEAQRRAVQAFLDTSLQSTLCVNGFGDATTIMVVLDNVAAGHAWPSGSAQDRRAWIEVTAYSGEEIIFSSGSVADGASPTELIDPNLWLIRDCLFDQDNKEVHMFWEATSYTSNLLPVPITANRSDPAFYKQHVFKMYPEGRGQTLPKAPDRVRLRVRMMAMGHDVLEGLDLDPTILAEIPTFTVGRELVWTTAIDPRQKETIKMQGIPGTCISNSSLSAGADKVAGVSHATCVAP